jgi:hypothetical protein
MHEEFDESVCFDEEKYCVCKDRSKWKEVPTLMGNGRDVMYVCISFHKFLTIAFVCTSVLISFCV